MKSRSFNFRDGGAPVKFCMQMINWSPRSGRLTGNYGAPSMPLVAPAFMWIILTMGRQRAVANSKKQKSRRRPVGATAGSPRKVNYGRG